VGIGVAGYGLQQLYRGYQAEFVEYLTLDEMSDTVEPGSSTEAASVLARAIGFSLVGSFLVVAALRFEPGKAGSLGDVLQTLLRQPFGSWLLSVVALGLVAYVLPMLAVARYGRIAPGRTL
jgi:hypothetical protein